MRRFHHSHLLLEQKTHNIQKIQNYKGGTTQIIIRTRQKETATENDKEKETNTMNKTKKQIAPYVSHAEVEDTSRHRALRHLRKGAEK